MRHYEACSCEARIEVRSWHPKAARFAIASWRGQHATCRPKPADEPHPEGDTYASTERAYQPDSGIGFRLPDYFEDQVARFRELK